MGRVYIGKKEGKEYNWTSVRKKTGAQKKGSSSLSEEDFV